MFFGATETRQGGKQASVEGCCWELLPGCAPGAHKGRIVHHREFNATIKLSARSVLSIARVCLICLNCVPEFAELHITVDLHRSVNPDSLRVQEREYHDTSTRKVDVGPIQEPCVQQPAADELAN